MRILIIAGLLFASPADERIVKAYNDAYVCGGIDARILIAKQDNRDADAEAYRKFARDAGCDEVRAIIGVEEP
jgi:hypothetical protein